MYARMPTGNSNGFGPSGLHGYAEMPTVNRNGHGPFGLQGITAGQTQVILGPDGQYHVSTGSQPTAQSIVDQITQWLGDSSVLSGVPNSLIAIGGILMLASQMRHGRR